MVSAGLVLFQACWQELPRIIIVRGEIPELEWAISFWEIAGGIATARLVHALGHVFCRRMCCFFDFASICQNDPELKAAGIANIPAFLRDSREFVVLWDDQYFTRLWCVYEIALAQFAGNIPIRFLPMNVYTLLVRGHLYWCAESIAWCLLLVFQPGVWRAPTMVALLGVAGFALQAFAGRELARLHAKLQDQFDNFDVRNTEITLESDRTQLCISIEEMFGSLDSFNDKVRTTLKSAVMRSLTGQHAAIPYWAMMWQTLLTMPFVLTMISSAKHLPIAARALQCVSGVTFVCCVLPLCSAAAIGLGKRFAARALAAGAWAVVANLVIGALVSSMLAMWALFVWVLPHWIGFGGMRRFGVEDWLAIPLSISLNSFACMAAVWAFRPQTQSAGVVVESSDDGESSG